jgi:hypothetical protein
MNKLFKLLLGMAVLGFGTLFFLRYGHPRSEIPAVTEKSTLPAPSAPQNPITESTSPPPSATNGKASNAASATNGKKFSEIGILERTAILVEIAQLDFAEIFELWLRAGRVEHDRMKQMAIGTKLAIVLRQRTPPPRFIAELRGFVFDPANPVTERQGVIGILGFTATVESVELLVEMAAMLPEEGLRQFAISGVRESGQMLDAPHEERSSPLEKAWRESSDPKLLHAASFAMAEIGAPPAVELLLESALLDDGKDDVRKSAALSALKEVFRENAIPPVAALLARQPDLSPATVLAGQILVHIGSAQAGTVLLGWLQKADGGVASSAHAFVVSTRSPALLKIWSGALDQSVPFRSEEVRQAIGEGLKEYRQARSLK